MAGLWEVGAGHSWLSSTLRSVRARYFWFNIVFFTGANICVFVIIKQKYIAKNTAHNIYTFHVRLSTHLLNPMFIQNS